MILLTLFVISEAVFATDLKGFCDTRSTSKNTLKLPILKPQTNIESEGTNCHIANLETVGNMLVIKVLTVTPLD